MTPEQKRLERIYLRPINDTDLADAIYRVLYLDWERRTKERGD